MTETPDERRPDLLEMRRRIREHLNDHGEDQGLRQRKKAMMRQLISDTATLMFLQRGFDEVRVSEVAAECDISEKTVYNYFPTKESLLFDREEESTNAFRRALGPDGANVSPVDAVVEVLTDELDRLIAYLTTTNASVMPEVLQFNELIERTPSLRAYRTDMLERFARVAAESMAVRAGVNPTDPEPQIAADALVGLWRVFYRAVLKYSTESQNPSELREAVLDEVRRAARLIDTGLWSFATVVQGSNGRAQFKAAADASNEARKQVMLAMKQARDAWRALKSEMELLAREQSDPRSRQSTRKLAHQMAVREANELRRQVHQERQEMKQEMKQAIKRARQTGRQGR
ncbi:MAG: TetR family transcriptional regulator [Acidimicrobiales bacterium]